MNSAMSRARLRPDQREASDAACGWNIALPSPPAMSNAASQPGPGASTRQLMNSAVTNGPSTVNQGRRMRSDSVPNSGWLSEAATAFALASPPAAARVR